ncbi:hypothetical protein GIB67_035932 [Kingdonia uniflora]|uniref:UvrD-like helicase ATP-binding domain-containing protein n=1 Tax=Kingdonia uniflora TaxID=39325 RepID=A0A7J7N0K6_9MAGN|nr:hypothetical protein GIB67_035932 [Kingdonia uniflora]
MEKITETFQSLGHYFGSYKLPLLEETRAELYSSMELISNAPFAEVTSLKDSKPYGSCLYDLNIDSWRNISRPGGKEPYKAKPGDILIISDSIPEIVSDLQRFNRTWTFASVTKVGEDEDSDISTYLKVRTLKAIEVKEGMRESLFAIFLMNITTNNRIWSALHMVGNLDVVKEVLSTESLVEEACQLCSCLRTDVTKAERLGARLLSALNKSQTDAVLTSISTLQCHHMSTVKLIWGPPGTGKTKTVSTLLWILLKLNCRTLSCTPTNVAISEVATRVLKLVRDSYDSYTRDISLCSLGDLLLFGNNDRLKVNGDLQDVFLDYRVDRLVECFAPLTGWKHCFSSMIDFLEDCVSYYHIALENESIKGSGNENSDKIESVGSFLGFVRKRHCILASSLVRCIRILCTHLPVGFILQENYQNMVSILGLLDSLENLLFQDDVDGKELEELFARKNVVDDALLSCRDPQKFEIGKGSTSILLDNVRRECLSDLRSLHYSLKKLDLPNQISKYSVREFCFQTASLIFCTASSSYKLHSVVMEPLDLLVIDEAAQLKECESVIPLQIRGIRHAILIGDECQLPAMVSSKVSDEAGFGRSLFERLSVIGKAKRLLNMQYRMHPKISSFPNSSFYRNSILDAPSVQSGSYARQYLPGRMFGPYSFISISDGVEELDDVGHSRKNMVEVFVVMKIVRNLFKAWDGSKNKLSIGIISPYNAQVTAIQGRLGQKYENVKDFHVKIKSVDGFQGGEEDIIIISTVRSNSGGAIGFLSNPQRTNVALTRAKHCLWILGNGATLVNSGSIWAALVCDAKERQCYFKADEDKDLAKAILQVKKELHQLDDLLKGDSILFSSSRWKVLFSDNFRRSFGNLRSKQTQKSVINLLLRISSGWRPKHRNIDYVCESSSQLVKQFKVDGLYLICTVDIKKESMYIQVLKIWDMLPLEEIPKLIKRLDDIFGRYTDAFISRCKLKRLEGNLEVPMTWETSGDIEQYKTISRTETGCESSSGTLDGRSFVENAKVSESLLLMKFYSLSSGVVGHLLSGRDGRELDLPFEVTDQEMEIILFPRSTFILGRSGTGKTTVLTMKLFQKEQQYKISSEGISDVQGTVNVCKPNKILDDAIGDTKRTVLRQLFVTVSPKLCFAIKSHISNLKSFSCGGDVSAQQSSVYMHDIDDTDGFTDIPDRFADIPSSSYPLVITFHKFLMMLDGSMENSYFDRFHEVREFSQGNAGISRSTVLQTFIRMKEVNFDRFESLYWPHFNSQHTKKLGSSAVFTEIISHIKGGLRAGEVPDGKLTREDYLLLSEGRVSSLGKERREMIYDIFLDYEKMKVENGHFDLADLVIDLHRRIKNGIYDGEEMDFVYIDEVQDLTMRQIGLFKYICRNVNEGFVFSGDTAQTIARGIDFRFQDIKSLFYKEFLLKSASDINTDKIKLKGQPCVSDIFHLSQNFRTHAGVLNLSQSVIDLLYRFFPVSIDVLSPETSLIYGEAPVMLESGNDENAIITIFGNSGSISGCNMVGFGAEQVILVRDDYAKKEILGYVGKQALVLTIVECKGLEFQDVLLYNFFGTSPLKNNWRVIYEYMNEQDMLDSTEVRSFPRFNKEKHNLLCSELKQLYVAITRTRQRLWISENSEEFSKPMFDYWKRLCLVQVRKLDESLAKAMQVASSKEEWSSRGIKLFNEGNFEMATMCFERAGDMFKEKWAKAAGLRASADRLRGSNSEMSHIALKEAAEIYETIGKAEIAAKCLIELKEFERAGKLYLEKCGEGKLEDAGDCFSLAESWDLAADVYARGNYQSKCLSVCTTGKLFDKGLQFIKNWKQNAESSVDIVRSQALEQMEQDFLTRCALHYHELKETKTMLKFVRVFQSMDAIRAFLKSWDYLGELVLLEEEFGNYIEAAGIARLKGDLLLEADMLGKGGHFEEASKLILLYVLANSLWAAGNKGWPLKHFVNKEKLLEKAKMIAKKQSDVFYESVCMETNALSNQEISLCELENCFTASQTLTNPQVEMISSRKILDAHFKLHPSKYDWVHEVVLNPMKHADEMMLCNRASIGSLVYFWKCWNENVLNIFEYLHSMETQDENENLVYEEICLGFLGVQKQEKNVSTIYNLLIPDAHWKKEIDERLLRKSGVMLSMDSHQFFGAARSYWVSEVLAVGMKVLETLDGLHKLSIRNSLSLFCQGTNVLCIFQVAKHLMEIKTLDWKLHAWALQKVQKFLSSCTEHFLYIVCPLDWRLTMGGNMVALRETGLYKDLVEATIIENINSKGRLTHGKIGRVVMLVLVSGKVTSEIYEMIAQCFIVSHSWIYFISELREHLESGTGQAPLSSNFQNALKETFNANWLREFDYISPHYNIYFLERLLLLVSSCQKSYFTIKSCVVETLSWENWTNWSENSCTSSRNFIDLHWADQYDHLAVTVEQLLYNRQDTLKWIYNSNINAMQYYPLLVLRLVVLVCLICLNCEKYPPRPQKRNYFGLLSNILGRNDITSQLPRAFLEILRRRTKCDFMFVLAEALCAIENPLVILNSRTGHPKFSCPGAIVIDLNINRSREDVVGILFPKNLEGAKVKLDTVTLEIKNPSSRSLPSCDTDQKIDTKLPPSSDTAGVENIKIENVNQKEGPDVYMIYSHFWGTFDSLKSKKPEKYCNIKDFTSKASQIKLKVEDSICLLDSAIIQMNQNIPSDNHGSLFGEATKMLDELKQLSNALSVSEEKLTSNISKVGELFSKLRAKKAKLQPVFDSMFMKKDIDTPLELSQASEASAQSLHNANKPKEVNKAKGNSKSKTNRKKGKGRR